MAFDNVVFIASLGAHEGRTNPNFSSIQDYCLGGRIQRTRATSRARHAYFPDTVAVSAASNIVRPEADPRVSWKPIVPHLTLLTLVVAYSLRARALLLVASPRRVSSKSLPVDAVMLGNSSDIGQPYG